MAWEPSPPILPPPMSPVSSQFDPVVYKNRHSQDSSSPPPRRGPDRRLRPHRVPRRAEEDSALPIQTRRPPPVNSPGRRRRDRYGIHSPIGFLLFDCPVMCAVGVVARETIPAPACTSPARTTALCMRACVFITNDQLDQVMCVLFLSSHEPSGDFWENYLGFSWLLPIGLAQWWSA